MKGTFGRYVETDSFLHQLDARGKIVGITLYTIFLFLANNLVTHALILAFTFFIFSQTGVSLRYILGSIKFILYLVFFTFVLHILTTRTGTVLLELGWFSIHFDAVQQGFYIGIRLVLIVGLSSVLTITTTPVQITDALESLLKPLQKIHIPVHEMALMLSLSLRFIPTLADEMEKVQKAQAARGMDFRAGKQSITKRIKGALALLVPLFIHAFRRADELADALEARGYRGGLQRTKIRNFQWHSRDLFALLLLLVFAVILLFLRT